MIGKFVLFSFMSFLWLAARQASAQPNWFWEPDPQDNYLYGTGSSTNKQEAQNLALQNAASKIRTTVSGTTRDEITRNSNNGNVSTAGESRNIAINQVEKIKISGFEVVNSTREGKVFYVRVRLDKNRIFNENSAVFEESINRFGTLANGLNKREGVIAAAQNAGKILKLAPDLKREAELLYALNDSFDYAANIRQINRLSAEAEALLSGISIAVESTNKEVTNAAKSAITASGFKTANFIADLTAKIEIEQPRINEVYGSTFCQNTANLGLFDGKNEVGASSMEIKGIGATEGEACRGSIRDLAGQLEIVLEKLLRS